MNKIIAAMYVFITFSLGSLPDERPINSLGGLLVIGIYEKQPDIKYRINDNGILLTMFEY